MLHAIVMAGGAGTRFWPASRAAQPKQLLRLVDRRTMLQSTVDRLEGLVPPERIMVATTAQLAAAVREQLPRLPAQGIVGEPCKRDTAPCIGLAAHLVSRVDPEAIMAVMPSDHVISPDEAFRRAIRLAAALVESQPDRIVTFGIRPLYPAESFGYIEFGQPLSLKSLVPLPKEEIAVYHVNRFREKPRADVARQYFEAGNYFWNSGIFVWRAATILDLLRKHEPDMHARLTRIAAAFDSPEFDAVLRREFEEMRPVSIDYAVMEKAPDVAVVAAPFQWDDVGSWQAISRLLRADERGNTVVGKHLGLRTENCIINTSEEHLVVTLGISDCLIVHTPDATLVANRHDEEAVRDMVKLLAERGMQEYL